MFLIHHSEMACSKVLSSVLGQKAVKTQPLECKSSQVACDLSRGVFMQAESRTTTGTKLSWKLLPL